MPRAPKKAVPKAARRSQRVADAANATSAASVPPQSNNPTDTLYFFSPTSLDGYLSQWYPSAFTSPDDHVYATSEQYMMHRKALLFAPDSSYPALILAAKNDPKECKRLGRLIPGFDEAVWKRERERIVEEASYLKFSQDAELRSRLLETGDRELVEAAPRDRVWGIGFGKERAPAMRERWGLNLLGKALMRVRERLRRELEEEQAPRATSE
jgi:ribA/ribD-fused uncharacterized protein